MKYIKLEDKKESLSELRNKSYEKGLWCGFEGLAEFFSLKKGYPLFIAGEPYHGKTEFSLELLMIMSELYGWKHFVYLGETGEEADIFAELCSKCMKKPYRKLTSKNYDNPHSMNEEERYTAEAWVNEHFYLMPTQEDFTFEEFYKNVTAVEQKTGIKFDTTLIDPVNDIKGFQHSSEYLLENLKLVRQMSMMFDRIDILVNHIGDTDKTKARGGVRQKLPALPDEWAGGKAWHRRAFTMMLVYRPDPLMEGEEAISENETWVYIQKSKPKGTGKKGRFKCFFDWKKNRYYEKDEAFMTKWARPPSEYDQPKPSGDAPEKPF